MRTTRRLLAATLLLVAFPPSWAASPAIEWTYQHVLVMSPRGEELLHVFLAIEDDPTLRETPMLDLLMEVVLVNSTDLPYSQQDLMRMTRIVYRSANPRYATAMGWLVRTTGRSAPYDGDPRRFREDVNEFASRFVKLHDASAAPQYLPGTIDINRMRANFETAAREVVHPAAHGENLLSLPKDATLDDVFAAAGAPEAIRFGYETYEFRRGRRLHDISLMALFYRGLGCANLRFQRGIGWRLTEAVVHPERFVPDMPRTCYDGRRRVGTQTTLPEVRQP